MMHTPLHLKITHIHGVTCQQNAVMTLRRDALLDNAVFETLLTTEQFSWLTNLRASVRCRSLGIKQTWWLQHSSLEFACTINDAYIAAHVPTMLHLGDAIEIGLLRLEVVDMPLSAPITATEKPAAPMPAVAESADIHLDETDATEDVPFLTQILDTPLTIETAIPVAVDASDITAMSLAFDIENFAIDEQVVISEDNSTSPIAKLMPEQNLLQENDHHAPEITLPEEVDDILTALAKQYDQIIANPDAIQEITTATMTKDVSFDADISVNPMLFKDIDDLDSDTDKSLEETILGALSVDQAFTSIDTVIANTAEKDIHNMPDMDYMDIFATDDIEMDIAQETPSDVLHLFADPVATRTVPSAAIQQTRQAFADSVGDFGQDTHAVQAISAFPSKEEPPCKP